MEVLTMREPKGVKVRIIDADGETKWTGPHQTMAQTIQAMDRFNDEIYWPLRNVIDYLGRMGVDG
jgi:hypothetical protein